MISILQTFAWRCVAVMSLLLALIGVVLPGLPTVPFILLSAWSAGKGWPRLEQFLLSHPVAGPQILQWRLHGVVPRKAKYLASIMIAISVALLLFSAASFWLQELVIGMLLVVTLWLWQRPERFIQGTDND